MDLLYRGSFNKHMVINGRLPRSSHQKSLGSPLEIGDCYRIHSINYMRADKQDLTSSRRLSFHPPRGQQGPQVASMPGRLMHSDIYSNAVYIPQQQLSDIQKGVYNMKKSMRFGEGDLYNDDEPLRAKVKQQVQESAIDLEIIAQRSVFKLKEAVNLPAMASIKGTGGSRTSVDLICVIDNSGSMQGQKIELVKETMRFLLETLTPSDRISIITFNSEATRLCPLKNISTQNSKGLLEVVNSIYADGGTNIQRGMELALRVLRERRQVNEVSSVFLLSDGQDVQADKRIKNRLQAENQGLGIFSIHSFGFGNDHDEELMRNICELKDGAFYYIKELATLDEAFCNALGGIISLAASEVVIKLRNISSGLAQGINFKKVYGSERHWKRINEKEYQIEISQLMSGISKDFVFELSIPALHAEVGDLDREHRIVEGTFTAQGVNGQKLTGKCELKLTMLNEMEAIPEENENVSVVENFLRVRAAEAIEENIKRSDMQQYEAAQKGIDQMIEQIHSNKLARKEKMEPLLEDLNQIRKKCSKQEWGSEGRKAMRGAYMAHSYQNNFQYSNKVQSDMVNLRKSMKLSQL